MSTAAIQANMLASKMYAALSSDQIDQIRDIFLQHVNQASIQGQNKDGDMKNI